MLSIRAFVVVCLAGAAGVLPVEPPRAAWAQIPGLPLPGVARPGAAELPLGVKRQGLVEVTGVDLDGRELFEIASPTVFDRERPEGIIPVEDRAREIEAKLERLVSPDDGPVAPPTAVPVATLDPATLRILVGTRNRQPVLSAEDAGAEPVELLTVTDVDARYHGTTAEELASRWRGILDTELHRALEQRQPGAARWRWIRVGGILLGTLLLSLLSGALATALGKRSQRLRQQEAAQQAAVSQAAVASAAGEAAEEQQREAQSRLAQVLREQLSVGRRLHTVAFLRWLLAWAILFLWVAAAAGVLYGFPQTRGIADRLVSTPVLALIAWFVTGLLNGFAGVLIDRVARIWSASDLRKDDPRTSLRIPTFVGAAKALTTTVLYTIAALWVLQTLRLISVSVVAVGAVAALVLSFAAQSLVKDLLNGTLILVEDQYALGDDIVIGEVGGVVERLSLRMTQLRTDDGRLVTIPNHAVAQVENKTRLWSRVDLRIAAAYATDVDRALAVVGQVTEEIARDPDWRPHILDAREMLRVEEVSHAGIVIRLLIKTVPSRQGMVAGELRRRLKIAFDRHGIPIGIPQQAVLVEGRRRPVQDGAGGDGRDGREAAAASAPSLPARAGRSRAAGKG